MWLFLAREFFTELLDRSKRFIFGNNPATDIMRYIKFDKPNIDINNSFDETFNKFEEFHICQVMHDIRIEQFEKNIDTLGNLLILHL